MNAQIGKKRKKKNLAYSARQTEIDTTQLISYKKWINMP